MLRANQDLNFETNIKKPLRARYGSQRFLGFAKNLILLANDDVKDAAATARYPNISGTGKAVGLAFDTFI